MISMAYMGLREILNSLDDPKNLIFLEPLVKDVVEYYMEQLLRDGLIKSCGDGYHIDIEAIEKLVDSNPQMEYLQTSQYHHIGFAVPSFLEFAYRIRHKDKVIVQEPGLTSAFVFYVRNLLNYLCKMKPEIIFIVDTILDKIVDKNGELLYGYKDMYMIESYMFLSDACSNVLLYVKDLRKTEKLIAKILNESDNIGIAIDIEGVTKKGMPANIVDIIKSRVKRPAIGTVIPMQAQKYVGDGEKRSLQKLFSIYGDDMIVILANTRPITEPLAEKLEPDSIRRFINYIEEILSQARF
ncbi:MAG: hypothetical protein QW632_01630 [Ignisphaera sp.]